MTQLRFAPLIRVSTEQQEKQGESLRTQKTEIIQYVKFHKGIIPEYCWQYSGQEHATPGQERAKLDQLLQDASKDLFDAVIVCYANRWSRDNLKSKEGLNILRANNIRFFVGTTEFDLYNPAQNLFLGMNAEIGEYQAMEQSRQSINNRISRARRGIPTAGRLPSGRTWDEINGWDVDKEKQKLIKEIARRYLAGEGIPEIARSYGIPPWNLWKVLTKRCGTEWACHFKSKRLNIDVTVIIKIPSLLDDKTIEEIRERIRINTTYTRGHRKYFYLLSGYIFCRKCGYRMEAYRNERGKQYYRHPTRKRSCPFHKLVPADELENTVLLQLVMTLGDVKLIEKSINKAFPDMSRRDELEAELEKMEEVKRNTEKQKTALVKAVADDLLTDDDIRSEKRKIQETIDAAQFRINIINNELDHTPNTDQIKKASKWAGKVISDATKNNPKLIFKRSYEWKRNLVEKAFSGVDKNDSRLGVYVDTTDVAGQFTMEIKGSFFNTVNAFPLSDEALMNAFNIDPQYEDVRKALEAIKLNMCSKRDAYHLFGLHQ